MITAIRRWLSGDGITISPPPSQETDRPLTAAEFFRRYPEYAPPPPPGVMVRTWNRDGYPIMDVFYPSWAAWRFLQQSPEYLFIRDPKGHTHKVMR